MFERLCQSRFKIAHLQICDGDLLPVVTAYAILVCGVMAHKRGVHTSDDDSPGAWDNQVGEWDELLGGQT
ncbi:hypothetical protein AAC03nite_06200 [Alicyclobacillus acidoterrestris]|nr:hypothetical protein AAC03nite_06200 [Alicyclobacillus acidoterrestris]